MSSLIGFLETYNGAVTAVATVFICAFTFALVCVTNRQAKLTREAINLSNKEFTATHRPRIVIRFIHGPFHDEDGREFIRITFANIGDTEATIYAVGGDLARRNRQSGDWRPPGLDTEPKEISPIALLSGERYEHTITAKKPVSDLDLFGDITDTFELCAVGAVRYRDGNGITRETAFFRIWHEGEGFKVSKNDQGEYQD
jgi:hypothetical protein